MVPCAVCGDEHCNKIRLIVETFTLESVVEGVIAACMRFMSSVVQLSYRYSPVFLHLGAQKC